MEKGREGCCLGLGAYVTRIKMKGAADQNKNGDQNEVFSF
jgi:hypothetical protein